MSNSTNSTKSVTKKREPKETKTIKESLFKKKIIEDKEDINKSTEIKDLKESKESKSTKIVLEDINRLKLEKNHVMNEDILMSSLRNSPKSKKMTKIKDIFNKSLDKEFSVKEKKNYIREMDHITFYLSMNGEMINMRNLEEKPIRCFHCHMPMNGIPLSVPIKYHETLKYTPGKKINRFFEEKDNDMVYVDKCYSKKDKEHPSAVKKDYFECIGAVCDFECAVSHAKMRLNCGDGRFKDSYTLLAKMYFMIHKKIMPYITMKPMFCYELLEEYGGMCKDVPSNITDAYFCINDTSSRNSPSFKISSCVYQELKK